MGRAAHLEDTRGLLIVNPRSGTGRRTPRNWGRSRTRERSVSTSSRRATTRRRSRARPPTGRLGVAGGDGSLGPVAAVALERDLPFVCVPFGTRNHFARDIGLDRKRPARGAGRVRLGRERRIDVGRVGDARS